MIFRPAEISDMPALLTMVDEAKMRFRERGIDQWQKGDPSEEGIHQDILDGELFVLDEDGTAVGMIEIMEGPDPNYAVIDGRWLNDEDYCAFHRVCVSDKLKGRGLAAALFSNSEKYIMEKGYTNVRIDTHRDNLSMQHALAKSGFIPCGEIILLSGAEAGASRIAYQKILIP